MQDRVSPVFLSISVALCAGFFAASTPATAAPSFAISATNVTIPSSGLGSTKYTVTAIPMTGTLGVSCKDPSVAAGVKIPTCEYGPLLGAIQVTAGQPVTGTFFFYSYGLAPLGLRRTSHSPAASLALAGVLLLGFWRRARRSVALAVLAAGALGGLASIGACGGNPIPISMTPGTYQYTLSAVNGDSLNNLVAGASTTVSVTVP